MKIKGVSKEQIIDAAAALGFRWDNDREEGRYCLGVLRMATSRMSVCGHKSRNPGHYVCTRKVHREGNHIQRSADGKIVAQWTIGDFVHPAYRFRKGSHRYDFEPGKGGNGAVCFHGHWRFMVSIFKLNPEAVIRTCRAAYLGVEDFHRKASRTGEGNVGSMMRPMRYSEACACTDEDADTDPPVTFGTLNPPAEPGGKATLSNVRTLKHSDLARCPFTIFVASHYREDGTCKCNDPEERERMKREWDYTDEAFKEAGVIQ
jgi:hypothetical protein